MDLTNARIKISGMGTTFGNVTNIIKEALEGRGYVVEVEDEHPDDRPIRDVKPDKHNHVKIETDHQPWPG
jgi:hypothetical protein